MEKNVKNENKSVNINKSNQTKKRKTLKNKVNKGMVNNNDELPNYVHTP